MPGDNDNFSDAPVSINEAMAARDRDATKWTPRDLLVRMLREIDNGVLNPSRMVVLYTEEQGEDRFAFGGAYSGTSSPMETFGLIEVAKLDLFAKMRG